MENDKNLKKCTKCGAKGVVVQEPLTLERSYPEVTYKPAYWYCGCSNISCENFELNKRFNGEQEARDYWNQLQEGDK